MTPELSELCEAYEAYRAQTIARHAGPARERLDSAINAYVAANVAAKGWHLWAVDLEETHSCKCAECGDVHTKRGRRPGLYINDKSLRQIVDEE